MGKKRKNLQDTYGPMSGMETIMDINSRRKKNRDILPKPKENTFTGDAMGIASVFKKRKKNCPEKTHKNYN